VKRATPSCPTCGSSATLPFESDDHPENDLPFAEIVLAVSIFFAALFMAFVFFLLSRVLLPAAILIVMTGFLFWRRQNEKSLRAKGRPRAYVCLDCSHTFKA
jgi:hypothetical protein